MQHERLLPRTMQLMQSWQPVQPLMIAITIYFDKKKVLYRKQSIGERKSAAVLIAQGQEY
jgi:hypothetical protein